MTSSPTTRRGKSFQTLVAEAKAHIEEITAEELREWQAAEKSFILVDVREPEDYDHGHIEKAVNIPRGLLELEADEAFPNQDDPIVLYCGGGSRSALAAETLGVMGYSSVYSLAQGYRGWSH